MKKISDFLETVGGVLMGLLYLVILFQVIARVILKVSSPWSVELGRVLFLTIVFCGAPVLVYLKGHMAITTLQEKAPPLAQKIIGIFNDILISLALIFLCVGAYEKAVATWNLEIPTLEFITDGNVYLVVFIGGMAMLLFTLNDLVKKIRRSE